MRKQVFGRKFKRDKNERKALFKSLMSSLIINERIQTTTDKAKAIKGQIEKLVTKARTGESHIPKLLEKYLMPVAIKKLINDIAPRFKERNGGYTRIIKLDKRLSDNAKMAIIEWVEPGISNITRSTSSGQISKIEEPEEKTKASKASKGKRIKRAKKAEKGTKK